MKFLWEIGCEELPPSFIPSAIQQLEEGMEKLLKENEIPFSNLRVYGTPRRLLVIVDDIAPQQKERVREIKGPPYQRAFDEKGKPTQSAIGFAKAQGVSIEELLIKEDKQGKYVYAVKWEGGRSTEEILKESLPSLLSSLYLPKSMRWDSASLRFIRPIRWCLALLDDMLLELRLGEITSRRITYLERYLEGEFSPANVDDYLRKMEEQGLILDQNERKKLIREKAEKLAGSLGGRIAVDDKFLEKIVFLNEKPNLFIGSIEERFLSLPKEIISSAMENQLNLIPLFNERGELLPYFIGVRDGNNKGLENVVEGYEQVLKARLADAHFFFEEDLKVPLKERIAHLSGIIFLGGLGTLADKVRRMRNIIASLPLDEGIKEKALKSALLCRADLTTNMVREFPDLQGVVGMNYALLQGEDREIAEAIYESYQYTLSQDGIKSPLGKIVSLVDKIDTLAGAFHLGLQPTGSSDPFALRRASQTVIDILREERRFNLGDVLEAVRKAYKEEMGIALGKMEELLDFLKNRVGLTLRENGIRYDIVNAVLAGEEGIRELFAKALTLEELRQVGEFIPTIMASVRLINIIRFAQKRGENPPDRGVREELLLLEEEKNLYKEGKRVAERIEILKKEEDYKAIFIELSSLKDLINRFFDKVLVMTEEDELRANRLALVSFIWNLFFFFGDLSQIVIEG